MILHTHSDASYLGETRGGRSRIAGFHFLGQHHPPPAAALPITPINGALSVRSIILDVVAAEAELGGLFKNMRDATNLRNILADFGYPQPATPIQTDNKCAYMASHKPQSS